MSGVSRNCTAVIKLIVLLHPSPPGSATNFIAAHNKKANLRYVRNSKLIRRERTSILFCAVTHPVNAGKEKKLSVRERVRYVKTQLSCVLFIMLTTCFGHCGSSSGHKNVYREKVYRV